MAALVCVSITVETIDAALADAALARDKGADLVELRIDSFFHGSTGSDAEDGVVVAELTRLLADSPLPVVLTCRSSTEGGDYDGDEVDRVALLEKLTAACETPPAYLDFELASYQRSANIRQKIDLCVAHPGQQREVTTRLILSIHDFEGRPADLDRRLLEAYDAPACSVVKVAYRARSIRDNLDLFELTRGAPQPTIALGMGEFGLMSRVLAPKFGGYLTFAALRDETATAPGQPTIDELIGLYRFRSIGKNTRVYGVIGWPVGHSLSPLIHNAGFEAVGHDGVYLPMPVAADPNDPEGSDASFKATLESLSALDFGGASVTLPHKERLAKRADETTDQWGDARLTGAANTLAIELFWYDETGTPGWIEDGEKVHNTDVHAIRELVKDRFPDRVIPLRVAVVGAGGVARAAVGAAFSAGSKIAVFARNETRANSLIGDFDSQDASGHPIGPRLGNRSDLEQTLFDLYINCTPVGMTGGPDPDGLSIPIPDLGPLPPETVFFDTVYNPVETPMLKAASDAGCRTIDGVEMFVRQAALQFELWTEQAAPISLFDRICRERLSPAAGSLE